MADYTYKPYALTLHTDAMGSAVHLPDILSKGIQVNSEMRGQLVANSPTPNHVNLVGRSPIANMSSFALATLLDNLGFTGLAINSATNPGIISYWQKFNKNGFAESSNHRSYTFRKGIIVPKRLTVSHRDDARLEFDVVPIFDGTNNAIVVSDAASLPTISINPARWTLGPITLGNEILTEYTQLEIDFGNTVETGSSESDIDPTHVAVRTHEPTITITGIDPQWMSSSVFALGGTVVAQATDAIYLRKRSGVGFVADGTAEHIKLTPNGILSIGQAAQAEAQRIGQTTIMVKLGIDSSGNAALAVDTTSAIT